MTKEDNNKKIMKSSATDKEAGESDVPLWKRVFLCAGTMASDGYSSFEQIYLVSTLQRFDVPYSLLSLPGVISGVIGLLLIPALGWASDRSREGKRAAAAVTLSFIVIGVTILIAVFVDNLYEDRTSRRSPALLATTRADNGSRIVTSGRGNNDSDLDVMDVDELGAAVIAGYAFGKLGHDTCTSTVRAYVLSASPPSQHAINLVVSTSMGAIGGCVTSLIGFLDLSILFAGKEGQVLDRGNAQTLVQSVVLVTTTLLLSICMLLLYPKFVGEKHRLSEASSLNNDTSKVTDKSDYRQQEYEIIKEQPPAKLEKTPVDYQSNYPAVQMAAPAPESDKGNHSNCAPVTVDMNSAENNPENRTDDAEKALEQANGNQVPSSKRRTLESVRHFLQRNKAMISLLGLVSLGMSGMSAYLLYITNYVAEVIYRGDPHASSDSMQYNRYVEGTRVSSLSMLTFNIAFVVYNIVHVRIIDKFGMRAELIAASLCTGTLTLVLCVTRNIGVLFANMLPLAAYRAAFYTTPFILANKYAQREEMSEKGKGKVNSGSAMAAVSFMVSFSHLLVSMMAGPLIELTLDTGLPIYCSTAAFLLSVVAVLFVHFD